MSFTKVSTKRRNKKSKKNTKSMICCTCSRCCKLNQLFPTKELSEAHDKFIFHLAKILTDDNFLNFRNKLIDQYVIYHKTLIYNRVERSKKTINELIWCDTCGIFMEANRYYIEMYLYYMYFLINTDISQFRDKKGNLIDLCMAIKTLEELSKSYPKKKKLFYTAEMKIIVSLLQIVNQLKPNYYVNWNKTYDQLTDNYTVNFGEQFHFCQLFLLFQFLVQYVGILVKIHHTYQ